MSFGEFAPCPPPGGNLRVLVDRKLSPRPKCLKKLSTIERRMNDDRKFLVLVGHTIYLGSRPERWSGRVFNGTVKLDFVRTQTVSTGLHW